MRRDTSRDVRLAELRDRVVELRAQLATLSALNRACCGSGASVDLVPGGEGLVVACAECRARMAVALDVRGRLDCTTRTLAQYCDGCNRWLNDSERSRGTGLCDACAAIW